MAFSYKAKILHTSARFPILEHTAFYFPPDKLLQPSADNQMVQTIRPEVCGASYQTKRTQNIFILPLIPTQRILLSTDVRRSPFLSRTGNVLHSFLLCTFTLLTFIRISSASFLQSARIARSRESNLDSCRPMSLGSYRLESRRDLQTANKVCGLYPFSPERETCCILPVNQLSRAYFLTKWKKCNIVSLFLQIHIVESTIHHSLMRMDSRQRIVSNACKSLIS